MGNYSLITLDTTKLKQIKESDLEGILYDTIEGVPRRDRPITADDTTIGHYIGMIHSSDQDTFVIDNRDGEDAAILIYLHDVAHTTKGDNQFGKKAAETIEAAYTEFRQQQEPAKSTLLKNWESSASRKINIYAYADRSSESGACLYGFVQAGAIMDVKMNGSLIENVTPHTTFDAPEKAPAL